MWHSAAGQWFSLCSTSFLDLLGVRKLSLLFWVYISSHSHQGIHRRPDCSSVLVHSSLSLESVWKNTYMALLWFAVCTEGFPSQTLSCGPLVWLLSAHWNPPLRGLRQDSALTLSQTISRNFKVAHPLQWKKICKCTKGDRLLSNRLPV